MLDELQARQAELKRQQELTAAHLNFVTGQLAEVEAWLGKAMDAKKAAIAAERDALLEKVNQLAATAGITTEEPAPAGSDPQPAEPVIGPIEETPQP